MLHNQAAQDILLELGSESLSWKDTLDEAERFINIDIVGWIGWKKITSTKKSDSCVSCSILENWFCYLICWKTQIQKNIIEITKIERRHLQTEGAVQSCFIYGRQLAIMARCWRTGIFREGPAPPGLLPRNAFMLGQFNSFLYFISHRALTIYCFHVFYIISKLYMHMYNVLVLFCFHSFYSWFMISLPHCVTCINGRI